MSSPEKSDLRKTTPGSWGAFGLWALIGASSAFFLLSFAVLAIVPVAVLAGITVKRPALRGSWFGALAGVGAMALAVAFLQRRGPGTVCWQTATAAGCDDFMNPWPWLAAGVILISVAFISFTRRKRG